ncbi:hypothetical protein GCM10010399_63770 [Dactylosporangium fulvum]|uniref:Uncharacterized protein n=1 Tax=Dactylosporangium fulvum TaxID=53359 RepID=A0ABY5W8W3_9ACTN|nr:hypothetical protein [Dactylosporangium fulvum]UWP85800.1 hypothetical protein Dfulv_16770 [Dactylosporangium fulvum]
MGSSPYAHIAYGYNLGGKEGGWKLAGAAEYGTFDFDWTEGGYAFEQDATDRLIVAAGFTEARDEGKPDWYRRRREVEKGLGVEIQRSGHHEYPGWMLVATGSHKRVEWADAMVLDLFGMEQAPHEWFERCTAAVEALGITPIQDGPRWLVFPSYG